MNVVLDASAMIAFLRGEPGADVVEHYFEPQSRSLYVHALNLCALYYDFYRAAGEAPAESAVQDVLLLGVHERNDMTPDFWRAVGKLKAEHRRVSLADCCALTLAGSLGATLLSADRHELEPLSRASVCSRVSGWLGVPERRISGTEAGHIGDFPTTFSRSPGRPRFVPLWQRAPGTRKATMGCPGKVTQRL